MARRPAAIDLPSDTELPDELLVRYGESLRAARLRSGLTQMDVADRTGLQQSYIAKIEAGKKNITIQTMKILADVVDQNLGEFFKRSNTRSSHR
jgi:transcriptional regulator with XRE-family HTH domain